MVGSNEPGTRSQKIWASGPRSTTYYQVTLAGHSTFLSLSFLICKTVVTVLALPPRVVARLGKNMGSFANNRLLLFLTSNYSESYLRR